MSGTVAAILLTIGSVVGSTFWSYQRSKQFEVERERNLKDAQLAASRQQRLNELRLSAQHASALSIREIKADRFDAASSLLTSSVDLLEQEPSLSTQREQSLASA